MNWNSEKAKLLAAYETALSPEPVDEPLIVRAAKPEPGGKL
jgi:hypothetical protein